MPVTNRHIVMLSGSARNAMSTCSVADRHPREQADDLAALLGGRASRSKNTPTVTTNDAATIAVAR